MRILVTGATGYVGRWLIPALKKAGHDICSLVRTSTEIACLEELEIPVIRDDGVSDLMPAMEEFEPFDGIIHLASLFLASHKSEDIFPLLTSNVTFPTRLIDAAVRSDVRWFVNTGTTWQHYEGRDYSPVNLYAATKQAFESVAQYYVEAHGLRFVTLALGDTYGPGDTRSKLLNLWCQIAKTGTPLNMSIGLQKIDLIYITDVVSAFELTVKKFESINGLEKGMPTFRVSSGACLSLRDLACLFEEVTGATLPIQWGARAQRPREVLVPWNEGPSVPDWQPKVSLREGLALLWEAVKQHEL